MEEKEMKLIQFKVPKEWHAKYRSLADDNAQTLAGYIKMMFAEKLKERLRDSKLGKI